MNQYLLMATDDVWGEPSHNYEVFQSELTPTTQELMERSYKLISNDPAFEDKNWFFEHYNDLHHGKPNVQYPTGQYEKGLYINSAHGSRGLTTCFISAELIASNIDATPKPFAKRIANALSPARFLIRQLKQNKVVR